MKQMKWEVEKWKRKIANQIIVNSQQSTIQLQHNTQQANLITTISSMQPRANSAAAQKCTHGEDRYVTRSGGSANLTSSTHRERKGEGHLEPYKI